MLRLSIILLVTVLLSSSCATPRPWTKGEKIAAGYFCLAHFADYYTTERNLDKPNHRENSPILNEYPSDSTLIVYISVTAVGALIAGHFWPELRKPLFLTYGTVNAANAIHNSQLD